MKASKIITLLLLLFVAVSVGYLMVGERGGKPEQKTVSSYGDSYSDGEESNGTSGASSGKSQVFTGVVAYYFHGNQRCATCRKIEALSKEAIETGFADELREGRLEWRAVNVEDPVNEHYIEEFQLATRSVVLERITGGERQGIKKLDRVWELVHEDRENFLAYIQNETREFFEAAEK
ncbi:MAG: hypothetical protein JW746_07140 [Candidatus Krumholzibacteriota bacterium]|nr:hypothetical protein [Candidatus Krumholzibacteriota bacterium]